LNSYGVLNDCFDVDLQTFDPYGVVSGK